MNFLNICGPHILALCIYVQYTFTLEQNQRKKERRTLVQDEVRRIEVKTRLTKAVTLKKQVKWLNWEGAQQRKLTWNDILTVEGYRLSFLLKSVYDVLPSPKNLKTWDLSESPDCKICGRPANLEHMLCSCRTALSDGRYRWRHDKVLSSIAEHLDQDRRAQKTVSKGPSLTSVIVHVVIRLTGFDSGMKKNWALRKNLNLILKQWTIILKLCKLTLFIDISPKRLFQSIQNTLTTSFHFELSTLKKPFRRNINKKS